MSNNRADWEKLLSLSIAELNQIKLAVGHIRERFDNNSLKPITDEEFPPYEKVQTALTEAESNLFLYIEVISRRSAKDFLDE